MSRRDDLAALLRPLSDRMHRGHSWVKTKDGPRRIDRKFDEIAMSEHVMGGNAFGLCPIAPGTSTCQVACLDFDSHKGETAWDDMLLIADGVAFALEQEGHAPHQFRSSGGNGIHIYLIWNTPQDAYSVREMLKAILASCGLKPGTGGVAKQEVEIFPKQDEVPHDGYGSMFVLPFSGRSEPIGHFQLWNDSAAVPLQERPVRDERGPGAGSEALDGDLARLKSALDSIPNSGSAELDYDAWRNTIFGIHHATGGSDLGLQLVHEFSSRSSKYDPDFIDGRVWPYIRDERGGAVVTDRSLYARAAAAGWEDPAIADAFGVIPDDPKADAAGPRYQFVDDTEFSAGAAPVWLIKDVLPHAGLAVVYGASGSGKTFFVLDAVAAVARGVEWRGRKTRKGKVGYIVAEGAHGFRQRLKALRSTFGQDEQMKLGVLASAPNFMEKRDVIDLVNAMRRWGKMDLIVVDTFAQVMPGANENAGEDVGLAIANCRTIHEVTGAMVLLIHHSGKDESKGARGWSGLRAAADVEIEIMRAEDDRVATVTKLKDGEDGLEFGFKLAIVPVGMDDDGGVVSSCVIEATKAVARDRKKGAPRGEWQTIVHQAAIDCQELDGGGVDVDALLTECVSRVPQDTSEGARDLRRQNCLKALTVLVTRGALVKEGACIKLPGGN